MMSDTRSTVLKRGRLQIAVLDEAAVKGRAVENVLDRFPASCNSCKRVETDGWVKYCSISNQILACTRSMSASGFTSTSAQTATSSTPTLDDAIVLIEIAVGSAMPLSHSRPRRTLLRFFAIALDEAVRAAYRSNEHVQAGGVSCFRTATSLNTRSAAFSMSIVFPEDSDRDFEGLSKRRRASDCGCSSVRVARRAPRTHRRSWWRRGGQRQIVNVASIGKRGVAFRGIGCH